MSDARGANHGHGYEPATGPNAVSDPEVGS
jgi:hypothetical protein